MEDGQMLSLLANALFDFKDSYLWKYLTSNYLKCLLGSLMIAAGFFWACFLLCNIQIIKQLRRKVFIADSSKTQKSTVPKRASPHQREVQIIESSSNRIYPEFS